jgi:peptidoglycan-associated lipoprotein
MRNVKMKHSLVAVIVAAAVALAGCHHRAKTAPPPLAPSAPPAAPATPPPAPPMAEEVAPQLDEYGRLKVMASDEIDRLGLLKDVHFEYDSADLRDADRQALTEDATVLKKFDFIRVTIEGHCDERGTVEYNLALGERRSRAALDYLVSLGVAADRLKSVSYGKEVPMCQQSNEDCWSRNRRDHFAVTGKVR